jgi:hypothetical protein
MRCFLCLELLIQQAMKKLLIITMLAVTLMSGAAAQNTPIWTANFDKTIEWTKLLPNGILLIGTSDYGMHGLEPLNGKILWSEERIMREASAIRGPDGKKTGYTDQLVTSLGEASPALSDFIMVKFTDNVMMKNFFIMNTRTGEMTVHPSAVGIPSFKVMGKNAYQFSYNGTDVLPELDLAIIQVDYVAAAEKGKPHYHFTKGIRISTGEELWKIEGVSGDFLPMPLQDGNLLYINVHNVMKIDPSNGKTLWSAKLGSDKKDIIKQVTYDLDELGAYVFGILNKRPSIIALDLSTGQQSWNKEFKAKGEPELTATRSGLVMSDEKNFVMYDFASGKQKWSAKKLDGTVVDIGNDGILVAANDKYLVNLDGETGAEKWSKKIRGIRIDQVTDKGIIYYEAGNALGAVDFSGKDYWKKNLPVIIATVQANFTDLIVLSNDDLYLVDLRDFSQKLLAKNVKFRGDEKPEIIEAYEDGVVVSSSQNYLMVDYSGNEKYKQFYRAPGAGGVLAAKILKTTLMVAGTAAASANAYRQGVTSSNAYVSNQYGNQRKQWENFTSDISKIDASKSYKKATKNSELYAYILTRVEENDDKGVGILKLNKISGQSAGQIVLRDSKPIYDIDADNGKIFHRVSNKTIACYNL